MTLVTVTRAYKEIPLERLQQHRHHKIFKSAKIGELRLWFPRPKLYFSLEALWDGYRQAMADQLEEERKYGLTMVELPPEQQIPEQFKGVVMPPKNLIEVASA